MVALKFTPLEFETNSARRMEQNQQGLKFTPLEFETGQMLRWQNARYD